jgi:ribonuclease BN (tRNA processing enzyme)
VDPELVSFAAGADLVIYDACYTEEEFPARIGWGHSTWRAGAELADAARVGTLVLFHHDLAHDDAAMDAIAAEAAAHRPGTIAAREGMELSVSSDGVTAETAAP